MTGNGDEDAGGEFDGVVDPEMLVDDNGVPMEGFARPSQDGVSVAAEIMSVDFLVDLANSTLVAANNLKDMLLAYQAGMPVANPMAMAPPTLEDLTTAREKSARKRPP